MKRPTTHDQTGEDDAVWELLHHSSPVTPSARFVDNTVRTARLTSQPQPWWKAIMAPAPITGLTAATAAVALIISLFQQPSTQPVPSIAHKANAAQIEEIAETEALIAAVDHMDRFSDTELVSLIGF